MSRKTIFIVDDDPTNLATVLGALEKHYSVLALNSGEKLLKTLERKIPDMILLDIEMPEMSGYDTIRILKGNAKTAGIPVIFLTAKCDSDSELEGLTLGAVDYIAKPIPPPSLLLKRIEVHLLVEAQKVELVHFNNNLQEMVSAKTKSILELQHTILKTIAELVECRDDITGKHIDRTTHYLRILLDGMRKRGLHTERIASWNIDLLLMSAQLHDVGKIAIKDHVLQKPGKLTPEEFEEIKRHSDFGAEIIEKIKKGTAERSFLDYAGVFAAYHHEKWDGTGYPRGLAGEEIPLEGRLMAIADVYDALVSKRPYKEALTHEEAVAIIKDGRGRHFDPDLVDLFVCVSDEFNKVQMELRDE
ncbi:MAG: response regulator [Chitinispirillales bacterium]|jgi:putative two-component system response regulator|nr:response regulator [Chitinispirillales bacterium]